MLNVYVIGWPKISGHIIPVVFIVRFYFPLMSGIGYANETERLKEK